LRKTQAKIAAGLGKKAPEKTQGWEFTPNCQSYPQQPRKTPDSLLSIFQRYANSIGYRLVKKRRKNIQPQKSVDNSVEN